MKRRTLAVLVAIALPLLAAPADAKTYFEASIGCRSSGSPADRVLIAAKNEVQAMTVAAAIVRSNTRYSAKTCAVLSIKPSKLVRADTLPPTVELPW